MNLVNTKMNIPIIRTKVVRRQELYKKLNQVLDYRVCLVTAPAGFGKTTLLASWINSEQKNKSIVTWLSLDEEDNTPEDFWSYFLMGRTFSVVAEEIGKVSISTNEAINKINSTLQNIRSSFDAISNKSIEANRASCTQEEALKKISVSIEELSAMTTLLKIS